MKQEERSTNKNTDCKKMSCMGQLVELSDKINYNTLLKEE